MEKPKKKEFWQKWWFWLIVIFLIIMVNGNDNTTKINGKNENKDKTTESEQNESGEFKQITSTEDYESVILQATEEATKKARKEQEELKKERKERENKRLEEAKRKKKEEIERLEKLRIERNKNIKEDEIKYNTLNRTKDGFIKLYNASSSSMGYKTRINEINTNDNHYDYQFNEKIAMTGLLNKHSKEIRNVFIMANTKEDRETNEEMRAIIETMIFTFNPELNLNSKNVILHSLVEKVKVNKNQTGKVIKNNTEYELHITKEGKTIFSIQNKNDLN